jgi:hypothetical protein
MRHANPAILVQFELSPNFRISQTKNLIIEQHLWAKSKESNHQDNLGKVAGREDREQKGWEP